MHWLVLKPSLTLTTEKLSVSDLDRTATVYVASYEGDRLIDIKSKTLESAEYIAFEIAAFGLNTTGATKMKAFLWDSNIIPQCHSASAELSEN